MVLICINIALPLKLEYFLKTLPQVNFHSLGPGIQSGGRLPQNFSNNQERGGCSMTPRRRTGPAEIILARRACENTGIVMPANKLTEPIAEHPEL